MEKYTFDADKIHSNEYKLLFLCSVGELSKEKKHEVEQLLVETINWELFLKILEKHRIYPLVYQNLKKLGKTLSDVPILDTLEQLCKKNTMQALKLSSGLIEVITLLERNNIKAISLKGPILSMELFGNIALRTSKDLDILVDYADIDKVIDAFLNDGYKADQLDGNLKTGYRKYSIATHNHFTFSRKNYFVEIHWKYHTVTLFTCLFIGLWIKSKIVKLSNKEIHMLSKEDEFLYLVFHGAKHGWFRLKWLCDISEIIKKNQINWNVVLEKAEKNDLVHFVVQALILVNRFYSVESPQPFLKFINENLHGQRLAEMTIPIIVSDEDQLIDYSAYNFNMLTSFKQKKMYYLKRFFPNRFDAEKFGFSDRFFFMYYIVRPFYKMWRVLQKCLKPKSST